MDQAVKFTKIETCGFVKFRFQLYSCGLWDLWKSEKIFTHLKRWVKRRKRCETNAFRRFSLHECHLLEVSEWSTSIFEEDVQMVRKKLYSTTILTSRSDFAMITCCRWKNRSGNTAEVSRRFSPWPYSQRMLVENDLVLRNSTNFRNTYYVLVIEWKNR